MRSSGIGSLVTSAAIVAVAFFLVALLTPPKDGSGQCEVTHRATLPDVPEASGLALSRSHRGVIWTHNDSGHAAVLFAVDAASGNVRGHVRVPVQLRDWEALATARCGSGNCLYLGDIGDNGLVRPRVQVLVVPEPNPRDPGTRRPDIYAVSYPDGRHNAEAMFVTDGRLFIISKDRVGTLYGSPAPLGDEHAIVLRRISELRLAAVTDAATSADETSVAVRTYHDVLIYRTADLLRGNVTPRTKISIDAVREPQGEGVALGEGGLMYLASEAGWLSRQGRLTTLRCSVPL